MTDLEGAGQVAARAQADAWFAFWSGLTDCPHIRPPRLEATQVRAWFVGHDAELRRLRRVWVRESVYA